MDAISVIERVFNHIERVEAIPDGDILTYHLILKDNSNIIIEQINTLNDLFNKRYIVLKIDFNTTGCSILSCSLSVNGLDTKYNVLLPLSKYSSSGFDVSFITFSVLKDGVITSVGRNVFNPLSIGIGDEFSI